MDLIRLAARKSALGEIIYVILNLAYAGLLFGLVLAFQPPWLAYLAVVLSKWRVFAVRPRFWFANLQTNMVDTLVGLSFVTLIWTSMGSILVQLLLLGLMIVWLIVVKPRSGRHWTMIQAAAAQFVSITALFSVSYEAYTSVVVAVGWLIGYTLARHVMLSYGDELESTFMALLWGFVVAELCWLAQHWTIAYTVSGGLKIPQIAIITGLLGFIAIKVYDASQSDEKRRFSDLRWPVIFVLVLIAALLLRFNGLDLTQL